MEKLGHLKLKMELSILVIKDDDRTRVKVENDSCEMCFIPCV